MRNFFDRIFTPIRNAWNSARPLVRVLIISAIVALVGLIVLLAVVSTESGRVPLVADAGNPSPLSQADYDRVKQYVQDMNVSGVSFNDQDRMVYVSSTETRDKLFADLNMNGLIKEREGMRLLTEDSVTRTRATTDYLLSTEAEERIEIMLEALDQIDMAVVNIGFEQRQSLFRDREANPLTATANVRLNSSQAEALRNDRGFVSDLQNAIAAQVADLTPENVVVMDAATSRMLSGEGSMPDAGDEAEQITARNNYSNGLEKDIELKLTDVLARQFGGIGLRGEESDEPMPPRFTVAANVEMDWDTGEFVRERLLPTVIREDNPDTPQNEALVQDSVRVSGRETEENYRGQAFLPEGSPGSEFNLPPGMTELSDRFNTYNRTENIENNEIGRETLSGMQGPKPSMVNVTVSLDALWRPQVDEAGNFVFYAGSDVYRVWEPVPVPDDQLTAVRRQVQAYVGTEYPNSEVVVEYVEFDRTAFQRKEDQARAERLADEARNRLILLLILLFLVLLAAGYLVMWIYRRRKQRKEEELLRLQQQIKQMVIQSAEIEGLPIELSDDEKERRRIIEELQEWSRKDPQMIVALMRTMMSAE